MNRNKVYLVDLKENDYDEYDSFVVIAKNKKHAWEMLKEKFPKRKNDNENMQDSNLEKITKIGESNLKVQMVLGAYNAG